MSAMPSGSAPRIISGYAGLRIETCSDVAAVSLLIYDYSLSFCQEVELIWPSNFNTIKVFFFLTRYMPFLDVIFVLLYQLRPRLTPHECKRTYEPAGWLILFGIMIAEYILVLRTWAIWRRTRLMAISLGLACLCAGIPVIVIQKIFFDSVEFAPSSDPRTPGCLIVHGNPIIAVSFIILIIFETFLLVLTVIKGYSHFRIGGHRRFVLVLYRDGVLFYVYLVGASLINVTIIIATPHDRANMLVVLQRALHSVLTTRILLNLRDADKREAEKSQLSWGSIPLPDITFR